MARDFEQVVGDARAWLRASSFPRPVLRTELGGGFGVVRRASTIIEAPREAIEAVEHKFFSGDIIGCIALRPAIDETTLPLVFRWSNGLYSVQSALTYYPDYQIPIDNLSGLIQDKVYEQLADTMSALTLQRLINSCS